MITDLIGYIDFFKEVVNQHPLLKDFQFGGYERILARHRTITEYPILFLEIPSSGGYDIDQGLHQLRGAFTILMKAPSDDWEGEDQDLDTTLRIGNNILNIINNMSNQGETVFDITKVTAEPIIKWTADNDWGYRFQITISVPFTCSATDELHWSADTGLHWAAP